MLNKRYWPSKVLNALACWSSNSELKSDITLGTSLPRDLEYVVNLKKKNKEKNAKQYYRYNDKTYVQLSSNYEKAIQNANESEFLHWNISLSKSKPKSFYHGKTELEKRQFYLYFEIIMERKKRSDGLSLKCKIIFRLSTCLLNSPSLNGSSPRLVYSRRNSGKCTGPRWRSPGSEPYPPAWRIQDTYNNIQITPIGQNRLIH